MNNSKSWLTPPHQSWKSYTPLWLHRWTRTIVERQWLTDGRTALTPTLLAIQGARWRCHSALTNLSLWTAEDLQVNCQLFKVTLPHKNQSAQTYRTSKRCVCVCACVLYCMVQCVMYSGDAGEKGFFPESLLMFSHRDPGSADWTRGLDLVENSPTQQHTHAHHT